MTVNPGFHPPLSSKEIDAPASKCFIVRTWGLEWWILRILATGQYIYGSCRFLSIFSVPRQRELCWSSSTNKSLEKSDTKWYFCGSKLSKWYINENMRFPWSWPMTWTTLCLIKSLILINWEILINLITLHLEMQWLMKVYSQGVDESSNWHHE